MRTDFRIGKNEKIPSERARSKIRRDQGEHAAIPILGPPPVVGYLQVCQVCNVEHRSKFKQKLTCCDTHKKALQRSKE